MFDAVIERFPGKGAVYTSQVWWTQKRNSLFWTKFKYLGCVPITGVLLINIKNFNKVLCLFIFSLFPIYYCYKILNPGFNFILFREIKVWFWFGELIIYCQNQTFAKHFKVEFHEESKRQLTPSIEINLSMFSLMSLKIK